MAQVRVSALQRARANADRQRRILIRAWPVLTFAILGLAVVAHLFRSDVFPYIFWRMLAVGLGCWSLGLVWSWFWYCVLTRSRKVDTAQSV